MTKKFDERQNFIRGKVFYHMYIITAILLLLNAFLNSSDIVWADGFYSSIIILMTATAIGSVEAIVRDAYFVKPMGIWISVVMTLCGIMLIISSLMLIFRGGRSLLLDGQLTHEGFSLIMSVLILIIGGSGIIKLISENLNKNERITEKE